MKRTKTFWIPITIYIMNLLAKGVGAICILALVLSCEDPNEIGLNINPNLQNLNVLFTEFPLDASNVQLDSVNTTVNGRLMMGKLNDPVFGVSTATGYTQLRPSSFSTSFPEGSAYDSLIMNVSGTYLYGDGMDQTQRISIHQLSEGIVDTVTYYSFNTRSFNSESIGELEYTITGTRPDTLRLSARMSDAFGESLFNTASTDTVAFRNSSNFDEFFKGLAFVSDPGNSMVFTANVETGGTFMTLYFSAPDDTVARSINFLFNAFTSNQFNGNSYFSNITTDVSGTPVAAITERFTEFDPIDNKIFSQAGNALYPKINLDPMREFVENNRIKVNRADIVIENVEAFNEGFEPPESLFFFITNETNNFLPVTIGNSRGLRAVQAETAATFNIGNELVIPFQEDGERQYEGTVTIYIQAAIIDGVLEVPEEILLVPFRSSSSLNRFSFDASQVKMRLFYTTFE